MKDQQAIEALAALARDSRLAVYRLLVKRGPEGYAAGEIAERLGLPGPTLSFHFKALAQAGLVVIHNASRFIFIHSQLRADEHAGGLPQGELLQPGKHLRP